MRLPQHGPDETESLIFPLPLVVKATGKFKRVEYTPAEVYNPGRPMGVLLPSRKAAQELERQRRYILTPFSFHLSRKRYHFAI